MSHILVIEQSLNGLQFGLMLFLLAAAVIWLAPKPGRVIEPGAGGH